MKENEMKNASTCEQGEDPCGDTIGHDCACADPFDETLRMVFQDRGKQEGGRNRQGSGGVDQLIETMKAAADAEHERQMEALKRQGRDSIAIGLVCALGVASLIGAAMTGVWIPVAVGLGMCLSGAAAVCIYRGVVILR